MNVKKDLLAIYDILMFHNYSLIEQTKYFAYFTTKFFLKIIVYENIRFWLIIINKQLPSNPTLVGIFEIYVNAHANFLSFFK